MLIAAIAQLVFIAIGSKYMGAAIPAVLLIIYLMQHFYLRTSRRLRVLDLEARAPLIAHVSEIIRGQATIRAYRWQRMLREQFAEMFDSSQRPYYLLLCAQSWLRVALNLMTAGIAVLLVTLATQLPALASETTFALAMLNLIGFGDTMAGLVASWTAVETSLGAIARLKALTNTGDQEDLRSSAPTRPLAGWPGRGHIVIKDVSASYG